jgi:hypothetical protein
MLKTRQFQFEFVAFDAPAGYVDETTHVFASDDSEESLAIEYFSPSGPPIDARLKERQDELDRTHENVTYSAVDRIVTPRGPSVAIAASIDMGGQSIHTALAFVELEGDVAYVTYTSTNQAAGSRMRQVLMTASPVGGPESTPAGAGWHPAGAYYWRVPINLKVMSGLKLRNRSATIELWRANSIALPPLRAEEIATPRPGQTMVRDQSTPLEGLGRGDVHGETTSDTFTLASPGGTALDAFLVKRLSLVHAGGVILEGRGQASSADWPLLISAWGRIVAPFLPEQP